MVRRCDKFCRDILVMFVAQCTMVKRSAVHSGKKWCIREFTESILTVSSQVVEPFDVTLVVQMSMARLQILETICLHWKGKNQQQFFFMTPLPGGICFHFVHCMRRGTLWRCCDHCIAICVFWFWCCRSHQFGSVHVWQWSTTVPELCAQL